MRPRGSTVWPMDEITPTGYLVGGIENQIISNVEQADLVAGIVNWALPLTTVDTWVDLGRFGDTCLSFLELCMGMLCYKRSS